MKKAIAILLAASMLLGMAACAAPAAPAQAAPAVAEAAVPAAQAAPAAEPAAAPAGGEGKVFNIYAWNEEFKGFFEAYYTVPEGVTVNWIINPSDGGVYQDKLDEALLSQESAKADDKIDMFLAEADYILKYVDSDYTLDVVNTIGFNQLDTMYGYTKQAATDSNGVLKGVACPCGFARFP